ncbi:MAG: hypothetical protein ABEJ66_02305, partial [Candidatus Nanohaloarchaea archaeon]
MRYTSFLILGLIAASVLFTVHYSGGQGSEPVPEDFSYLEQEIEGLGYSIQQVSRTSISGHSVTRIKAVSG